MSGVMTSAVVDIVLLTLEIEEYRSRVQVVLELDEAKVPKCLEADLQVKVLNMFVMLELQEDEVPVNPAIAEEV